MKQVLLVDDSAQIRVRIAALLSESPLIQIVGQAGSGEEAWKALHQSHPDTVVLDIRLPDVSGVQLLKQIKMQFPTIRVIMLSNFDSEEYRRQCRRFGADYFIGKTKGIEDIVDAVLADT